ncbi:MAG: hypothetical protein HZA36_01175 [Parcubacteria group bacterium]|nr:hypothetical protein [Parcubacteria group bacterium]
MMVRADNRLTFIDFGTARDVGIPPVQGAQANGTAVGTPGYAAPEQWSGKLDTRSDLYALGVIMKELLSGNDPVVFDTQPLTGQRLELCSFINKATKLDANERYQTVAEMRQELEGTRGIVSRVLAGITTIQPQQHRLSLEEVWNEIERVRIRIGDSDWKDEFRAIWINAIEFERRGCLSNVLYTLREGLKVFNSETASSFFAYGIYYEWLENYKESTEFYRKATGIKANITEAHDGIARIEAKIEQGRQAKIAQKLARKAARNVKIRQTGGAIVQSVYWLGRQLDPRSLFPLIAGDHAWMPHIAVLVGTIFGFALSGCAVSYDFPVLIGIFLEIAFLLGCVGVFQAGVSSFRGSYYISSTTRFATRMILVAKILLSV